MAHELEPKPCTAKSALKNYFGLVPVALAFAAMVVVGWRKWPDVLIDFGAQLYIPWQLSLGEVLYRDVAYLPGGPLSQYFNALLFKIFGVSFTTLIFANLIIATALVCLIYRFFLKISNAFTATSICLVIVLVFASSEYLRVGNYNYISPYAHEALHGLLLSVVAITFLSRWNLRKSLSSIAATGFCFGCVFLTKPELFIALAAAVIGAFAISSLRERSLNWPLKSLSFFSIAAAIPLIIAFSLFRSVQNSHDALRSVLWAWIPLLTKSAANNQFYQWVLGLDDPAANITLTIAQFVEYGFCIVLCAWASRSFSTRTRREQIFSILIFVGLIAAAFFNKWFEGARALLLFTPTVCATLIWFWRKSPEESARLVPAILWSIFSLALLAKLGVHSRIWHYGFYLAMPATAAAIYFVFWFLPRALQRWNVQPIVFRTILCCAMAIGVGRLVMVSTNIFSAKTFVVGRGQDRVISWHPKLNPTGRDVELALQWIEKNCPEDATLAALPEGVMLNYQTRRSNPTPYINFMLPEWKTYGEKNILSAFQKNPPDYVVLVHKDTSEYGVDYFGQTEAYGLKTMQWINANYSPVYLIGNEPLRDDKFGIKFFKRK
jgi:hypothetical protein